MPNKPSLELSDVQRKVIEELEVLTDAFVSTFNELGKTIKAYSEEIAITIEKFTKEKTEWTLYDTQCFDLSYIPFREYADAKKISLDNLMRCFHISGQKVLVKNLVIQGKKRKVDVLSLCWGFTYDVEDAPYRFFYVQIIKEKSPNGAVFSVDEYEKLANEIKTSVGIQEDDFYVLEHPDKGYSEYFYVWLDFKYYNELAKFFKICKDELIEKFLSKIKD